MQTAPPFSHNHTNPLLMKDDVGKSKPSTFNLPNQDFVYGQPLARDKEGAKEVTMTWKFHQESQDRVPNRDFPELNKQSIHNGSVKAHVTVHSIQDMYKFRQTHDARLKLKKGTNIQAIELPEEEFRYGRKNRPSTPMKLVMGNSYGIEAESQILDKYQGRASSQVSFKTYIKDSKLSSSLVKGNKASQLFYDTNHKKLAAIQGVEKKEPFKMEKFKTVNPKINTNLSTKK
ncbi:unnamed protein product (macronuclear) [Paramecium tetraurelia]|uniref:Uncharacterized protein n=1 Tax=Paramecium tetraurelia TaxID=5888 RepID=A0BQP2_PARTE|nr:uncharacterized protein GSPATT00031088001 [Paramecium tetraurelia]CAK60859.1 unnamed protein product [Paramecium tetraurelia]|eukprot:XP_001428257.1 hypothetical protein (macronuclear) [Paramecium tetraurelia strain d4-2]